MLSVGPCNVTGQPGIRDDDGDECACTEPSVTINCDGSPKASDPAQELLKQDLRREAARLERLRYSQPE